MHAWAAFEGLVALVALQRLVEMWHSRRNLARLTPNSRPADSRANWCALVTLQVAWLLGCGLEPALRGGLPAPRFFWLGLVVVITEIGRHTHVMSADIAQALVGAALLSTLVYPTAAGIVAARAAPTPTAGAID